MAPGVGSPSIKGDMLNSLEQHVPSVRVTLVHLRGQGLKLMGPKLDAEDDPVKQPKILAQP